MKSKKPKRPRPGSITVELGEDLHAKFGEIREWLSRKMSVDMSGADIVRFWIRRDWETIQAESGKTKKTL